MNSTPSTQSLRETMREADAPERPAQQSAELTRLLAMEAKIDSIRPDRLAEMQSRFEAAFTLARVRKELLGCFTPEMMALLRELENTPIGFRTDRPNEKNPNRYDEQTLKECACEAVMRGLRLYGNEFNIISGRVYVTSEGLGRLLNETTQLNNLQINFGLPRVMDRGAVVPVEASWVYKGVAGAFKTEIVVRLNAGMGADGAVGKALRKARYRVLTTVTGSTWVPVDGEVETDPAAGKGPPSAVDSAAGLTKMIETIKVNGTGPDKPKTTGTPEGASAACPESCECGVVCKLSTEPTKGVTGAASAQRDLIPRGGTDRKKQGASPLPEITHPKADDKFAADIIASMPGGSADARPHPF